MGIFRHFATLRECARLRRENERLRELVESERNAHHQRLLLWSDRLLTACNVHPVSGYVKTNAPKPAPPEPPKPRLEYSEVDFIYSAQEAGKTEHEARAAWIEYQQTGKTPVPIPTENEWETVLDN